MDKSIMSLAALVGRRGQLRVNGLMLDVTVRDVKQSYGEIRYLITPVAGHGEAWVTNGTFKLDYPEETK